MTQTASDATLAFVFQNDPKTDDGLCDPFAESAAAVVKPRRPRAPKAVSTAAAAPTTDAAPAETAPDDATYTFRFDVEVPLGERGKCGAKFMKQWKRVLQAQKLTPLVAAKLPPHDARFQLCVSHGYEAAQVAEREAEIVEQLMHLRRDALPVRGETAGELPTGWEGVRVWMTFGRRDVEAALTKKPKI